MKEFEILISVPECKADCRKLRCAECVYNLDHDEQCPVFEE